MLASSLSPLVLLITRYLPAEVHQIPCLAQGYHGTSSTGNYSFYATEIECAGAASFSLDEGQIIPLETDARTQLVWFEQVQVDSTLPPPPFLELDVDDMIQSLVGISPDVGGQQVISGHNPTFEILRQSRLSVLIRMDRTLARHVDTHLPLYWRSMILPDSPISYVPVPPPAIGRVKDLLARVKFDPVIASIVNQISISQMQNDIRYLTGEDPESNIVSRHSFSEGVLVAANWLKERFEETGARCELRQFLEGFAPNVICSYPSTVNTTEIILLSSHYDSRGSFGSTRAPGGDDDGSGTVGLLSIARTIGRSGLKFKKNVQLVAFAGEEQGLLGSRAYSRELREADADLLLMIQADMTGYHKPGEPLQLGLPATIGTAEVAQLIANASALYSPELTVGITTACCSDHQSFHEQGYPATQVFERAGPIADPMYHNSGDISEREGYDFEQITAIARAEFATLLHAAGFDLPKHQ